MNFLKRLFNKINKNSHNSDEEKNPSLTDGESFYTSLEEIIPVFFEGKIEKRPFFNELVNIPLIMPTLNSEETQPLVIAKQNSNPLVVFTTSPERLEQIKNAFSNVTGSTTVSLAHYMSTIPEPVSIVINPGWKFEFTITKESVADLMRSISMEFCNLDIMVSRYFSNQITLSELIKAIKSYHFGVVLREDDVENMESHIALIERAGEIYSCVFSSEEFATQFRENNPEFQYSANAKGEEFLKLLPVNCGVILNPDSEYELLINTITLQESLT